MKDEEVISYQLSSTTSSPVPIPNPPVPPGGDLIYLGIEAKRGGHG